MNKRNNIITCGALIIAAFLLGFFVGEANEIVKLKNSQNNVVSNSTNLTTSKTKTTCKAYDKKDYKFGQEGKSGNWNIKLLDVQETNTIQAGDSEDNKTTQQKFIVIKLQMTDIDKLPHQYSSTEFILGNIKDKNQYSANFDAMEAANEKETIYNQNGNFFNAYDDINPNTPKQTYLVFEVPKDFNIADGVLMYGTNKSDLSGYYIK